MDLFEYRGLVRSHADSRDGKPIYNASQEHASIVIENLFRHANSNVDILSGAFNARVYGRPRVVEEARLFLSDSHNHNIRIILEEDLPEDRKLHPFFQACSDLPNIKLRIAPKELQELYGFHFIVADSESYRFEGDKAKPSAVAAFGHTEGAENLSRIFGDIWDYCAPASVIPV